MPPATNSMKYCPICDTRFDEEIIRFCTKDGTPLIEEAEPNFTELPSENLEPEEIEEDDIGEITMIRRKDVPAPPPNLDDGLPEVKPRSNVDEDQTSYEVVERTERIVIPTTGGVREQAVRPRTAQAYYPPPQSNTMKTVVLTVFLTLLVLGAGAGLFWFLQKDSSANKNLNVNTAGPNVNLNANIGGIDSNFNFNSIPLPSPINTNLNANVKSPTPTPSPSPKPSPSVTPTPSPSPSATPSPTPTRTPTGTPRPTPSGTPRQGPRPTPNPGSTP